MKKILLAMACLITVSFGFSQGKKAVFIIIDGVSKDVLDKLPTPNIDAIAKEGALLAAYQGGERGAYNETPTISAPGYNNVLTGVWFNKHNVPDNDIKAPNYHYPTIFSLLESQHPEKTTAVFSSWKDNRTKLIGEGLTETGKVQLDYHFDGLELDTVRFPHDRGRKFMAKIDQAVTDEAAKYITEKGPDLSWVYLEYTDDMGHMYGDHKNFFDAVQGADKMVGQIWTAIKKRMKENKEEWIIVVTTDHGRDVKTGKDHGGQSDRERASWIATNAGPVNQYAGTKEVSVVDILPTITRFMDLSIPVDQLRELDGRPLIGNLSVSGMTAKKTGEQIDISWAAGKTDGPVKIWLASSNNYRETGKADEYLLAGEVPVTDGKFVIDLKKWPASDFYKVVLEGKYNTVNRWVQTE